METQKKDTATSRSGNQQVGTGKFTGFGKFMVDLAGFLTVQIVLNLATYFEFSKVQKDTLRNAEYPGQLMVDCLRERGIITPDDISTMVKALEYLKLDGVKLEVLSSFRSYLPTRHQSSGQLGKLRTYLKFAYELLYKAVQPIPYIRDRLYCVNDVFVEGGIELINSGDTSAASSASSSDQGITKKYLKSYRDIFDDNVVPSKRVIVEGEPGFGKSTLTLQAAYSWCEENSPSSALLGVELFILLPLRLLKGITSIYKAIKLFILPRDCNLTESEIEAILTSCKKVVIVLDGFDEYPDIKSDLNSDVMEIIKGKMFTNFKLVLCTRAGCIPSNLDPRTVRVRLRGFDADARDRYITLAVVGGCRKSANEIKQNLQKNPIMCDLCQVPLFLAMFAHMTHESKDIYKCDSVTSFFNYMIHCFYSHMWKKEEGNGKMSRRIAANTSRLYKVAFDGLVGDNQTLVWDKKQFRRNVGTECFDELIKVGILIQETFLEVTSAPNASLDEYVKERHTVRFYHKLFAEWYAAHYLAERASSIFEFGLNKTIVKVNPLDLQFVFRFACGLKPSATKRIVSYLQGIQGGDPFATLCILEQSGSTHNILDVVNEMCSKGLTFQSYENQLLQRSRIQLLSIASKNQVPVSSVTLWRCFQSVDLKVDSIYLSSGLQLPRIDTLKELEIYGIYDLRDSAKDVLNYSARCVALKIVKFSSFFTLLPQSFDNKAILARLHRKNCKVAWKYEFLVLGEENLYGNLKLNLQSGKWEDEKGEEMTDRDYQDVVRIFEDSSDYDKDSDGHKSEDTKEYDE